ncbi:MAG: hypothetical protein GX629_05655 [Phycisphaerae bacterium]|jgi:V/A-type H+-transporting ATPase subunit I|nr:hypothetical protein [Phycisphaerae bacterium]
MIVKMSKVFIAARSQDREKLLEALRTIGVVHVTPVDPTVAVADEKSLSQIRNIQRAIQVLQNVEPAGTGPDISAIDAAHEVLEIQQRTHERQSRLTGLYRQLDEVLRNWGEIDLKSFDGLRDAGIEVEFYSVPAELIHEIQAEMVEPIRELPGRNQLVAVIDRTGKPTLPKEAKVYALPANDPAMLREEAAEIDARMKQDLDRLASLRILLPKIKTALVELEQKAEYEIALRSAMGDEDLYAIQGWIPTKDRDRLPTELARAGIDAAVETIAPAEDEVPPTLISSPRWARPIKGLFDVLGTVSGYREFDVSVPFMIALPIFSAMLIGDGGYGFILLLGLTLFYKKVSRILGPNFTKLMIVISAATLVWGTLTGSFFGFTLLTPVIPVDTTDRSRYLLMEISFVLGAVHLCFAHFWQAARMFPSLQFLSQVGWGLIIAGMLGVVRMFVLNTPMGWETPWPYLILVGSGMAILFHSPSKNIFKMVGLGVANFPFSVLSTFSDIISYVRLMAVGLAGSVLAVSFNDLGLGLGSWFLIIPVIVIGHALNLFLALIALFAHGVRLNMLEFSNNLGMQWTGYSYKPFSKQVIQE